MDAFESLGDFEGQKLVLVHFSSVNLHALSEMYLKSLVKNFREEMLKKYLKFFNNVRGYILLLVLVFWWHLENIINRAVG